MWGYLCLNTDTLHLEHSYGGFKNAMILAVLELPETSDTLPLTTDKYSLFYP